MNHQNLLTDISGKTVTMDPLVKVGLPKVPLILKIAISAFLVVFLPVYLHVYGPTNFLWFCDAALIITTAGMWLENSLLISMCAVGILIPQFVWIADFNCHFFGIHFLGMTGYMFESQLPLFIRGLSLFHVWLPLLLLWLLFRLGYDQRALIAWTSVAAGLVLVCYYFTPAAGFHPADSNTPININFIYGFNDQKPQQWINQNLYIIIFLVVLWLAAFLPTHLILRKIFASPKPMSTGVHAKNLGASIVRL